MTQPRHRVGSALETGRNVRAKGARPSSILGLLMLLTTVGCNTAPIGPAPDGKEQVVQGQAVAKPGKYHFRESQFVFFSDFPLKQNLPIFQELSELREQIRGELQLPESNTLIKVYLFEDEAKYVSYMRANYTNLPIRRAFFVKLKHEHNAALDDLFVFTWWGVRIRQDLRHELTHGILHSVCKDVPLWLDEGLAGIYELPPENNGVNSDHIDQVRRGSFQSDLARLEKLSEVKQMLKPEYREAWAWAHFMLRGKPEAKAVLLSYMQQLRTQSKPPPLLPKLEEAFAAPNDALAEHLSLLEFPKVIRTSNEQRLPAP
jgi:hypothetical protein